MTKGTVSALYHKKGFGFIEGEDKRDYFFHFKFVSPTSISFRHFKVGQEVQFDIAEAAAEGKNLQARNVVAL